MLNAKKKVQRTPLQDLEQREREMEERRAAFKDDQLAKFLASPDPETLSVHSVGTCPFCKYHGAGPAHWCSVWSEHHRKLGDRGSRLIPPSL